MYIYETIIKSDMYKILKTNTFHNLFNYVTKHKIEIKDNFNMINTTNSNNVNTRRFLILKDFVSNDFDDVINKIYLDGYFIDEERKKTVRTFLFEISKLYITVEYFKNAKKIKVDKVLSTLEYFTHFYNEKIGDNKWYRGQSNFKWRLLPSFYRDISLILNQCIIDRDYLCNDYKKKELSSKYNDVFTKCKYVNYEFLSYMQHSVSYSPLLDFTDNPYIATMFSINNKSQFNIYNHIDSNLICIEFNEDKLFHEYSFQGINSEKRVVILNGIDDIDSCVRNISVEHIKGYKVGAPMRKTNFPSAKEIIKYLTPDIIFIDAPLNDRMKYQQGKFIFFNNFVMLDEVIFYELNNDIQITNYIIEINNKTKVRNNFKEDIRNTILTETPQYDMEYLLDPYRWLNK